MKKKIWSLICFMLIIFSFVGCSSQPSKIQEKDDTKVSMSVKDFKKYIKTKGFTLYEKGLIDISDGDDIEGDRQLFVDSLSKALTAIEEEDDIIYMFGVFETDEITDRIFNYITKNAKNEFKTKNEETIKGENYEKYAFYGTDNDNPKIQMGMCMTKVDKSIVFSISEREGSFEKMKITVADMGY